MKIENLKKIISNEYFLLTLITILGLTIRLINIDKKMGLWNDEIVTYYFISKHFPLGIISAMYKEDYHMPLFYIFSGAWIRLFGTSDIILRLSSVFWGVLTIPAFYSLGKAFKSKSLGFLMASICSLSPLLIYYSQEFRIYSLVTFLSTLSVTFFIKFTNKPQKKYLIGLLFSNLALLYTYTFGLVFVGLELAILTLHIIKYKKNFLKTFVKYLIAFIVLAIPYLYLLGTFIYAADNMIVEPIAWELTNQHTIFLLLNDWFTPILTCCLSQNYNFYINLFQSQSGFIYFALMTSSTVCFLTGFICSLRKINKQIFYLSSIIIFFLLYEFFLQAQGNLVITSRYTLVILPIIFLICLNGLISIPQKPIKTIFITIIIAVLTSNLINYKTNFSFRERLSGFRTPAQYLMELKPNGDYLFAFEKAELFSKYLSGYKFIDFDAPRVLYFYKDKKKGYDYFGKNLTVSTTKHNVKYKFFNYLTTQKPTKYLTDYINKSIEKVPSGKRLVFLQGPYYRETKTPTQIADFATQLNNNKFTPKNENEMQNLIFCTIIEKMNLDTVKVLNSNKSLVKISEKEIKNSNIDYSEIFKYKITVYKKL